MEWCAINYIKYEISSLTLGIRLKNMNIYGIEKGTHTKKGKTKKFNINALKTQFNIDCGIDINFN